ncbi:hypothetical protein [Mucilaginibacter sp. PAMB04168]|uniref:hypothetical protein n=1 Tax=Mucilaginibacter sp. PAMB04168 TaxID=3138567 RepID=UPI0031F67948
MKTIYLFRPAFIYLLCVLWILLLAAGCKQSTPKTSAANSTRAELAERPRVSFKKVHGIAYTEVRREYSNRLGFSNDGYHLEPEWRVTFLSDDTVRIFSLVLQRFIKQEVVLDHDSVVNVAHSWLRVKHLSRDSMIFQVLYVRNLHIDEASNITMKLYSNDYIKNVLHTTPAELQKPPRRDTLFIQKKVKESVANMNKAFAAYEPVVLQSLSPNVQVKKKEVKKANAIEDVTLADNYLSPTFDITIHKAYANFNQKMQLIADEKGKLHFVKPLSFIYDEVEQRKKVMKGIVDGYLTVYLKTIPGKTLGMPHASRILVNVTGIQD